MISRYRPANKESGQSTTEYALTIAVIALFVIGAIYAVGSCEL